MSSTTSILDDQTTDGSIDTEYFTASSHSSSTVDDIANCIKGIVIVVKNREIIPYNGSGEMISKKCTSCEQNIDDSITTDNKEAVNVDDLYRIISYITSTKEDVLFSGDTLSRIVSFLTAIDVLKLAQTCRRFGSRGEGELSLRDEALFKQPPPLHDDCQICELRLPTLLSGIVFMPCCGKDMCGGCCYASFYGNQGNEVDNPKCPFCRSPPETYDDEEIIQRYKKRADLNDPLAIYDLGYMYQDGEYGLPQDYTKALELWHRAAELGNAEAYCSIGHSYDCGKGVEVDKKKAKHYFEVASMRGNERARYNLGLIEESEGNTNRALKHYLIAVGDGHSKSLKKIQRLYSDGHATKDEHIKALRAYQKYFDEIKSTRRDEAAAANDKYRYYC